MADTDTKREESSVVWMDNREKETLLVVIKPRKNQYLMCAYTANKIHVCIQITDTLKI